MYYHICVNLALDFLQLFALLRFADSNVDFFCFCFNFTRNKPVVSLSVSVSICYIWSDKHAIYISSEMKSTILDCVTRQKPESFKGHVVFIRAKYHDIQ